MKSLNKNGQRVFYHELGHFVANTLNNKLYQMSEVTAFSMQYDSKHDDYMGKVTMNNPPMPQELELKLLSAKLVSLMYGCLMQVVWESKSIEGFKDCFRYEGCFDAQHYSEYIKIHLSEREERTKIFSQEYEYLQKCIDEELLKGFINFDGTPYMIENGNDYDINIAGLKEAISSLMIQHEDTYRKFVEEQQALIEELYNQSRQV